jgi:ABC-type multidrug transport system ATPase subunit
MELTVDTLTKQYQTHKGIFSLSFRAAPGECIAVAGHNGAGKSTLLKMLSGWIIPDSGKATINGVSTLNRRALVRNVGFVPETPNLFETFSVEYNLRFFARLFHIPLTRVADILHEFDLWPFRHTHVQTLSRGLRQRVSLGRSLLADPQVILLDEPTAGLDVEMTVGFYQLLRKRNAAGKTILFSSHHPEEIRTLASRVIVLHRGEAVFDGLPGAYFQSQVSRAVYV